MEDNYVKSVWSKTWVYINRRVIDDAPIINFAIDGIDAKIAMLTETAPDLSKALLEHLPLKGYLIHGCWSGDMVRSIELIDLGIEKQENQTSFPIEGDFCYYPPHQELTFSYGEAHARMPYGQIQVSVIGRVIANQNELTNVFRNIRLEGAKYYEITRIK